MLVFAALHGDNWVTLMRTFLFLVPFAKNSSTKEIKDKDRTQRGAKRKQFF